MNTMKAVVKYENKPCATELREVPIPQIGEDDVLVEVAYVGVCGTDPHMHKGSVVFNFNCPFILGHEFAGKIVKVGRNVKGFAVGDRVTAETHADYCGKCTLCRTNNYHLCRGRKGFGFHCDGAYAKYVKVPQRILHRVPEGVSLRAASITEPLCVAYKAVVVNSTVNPGDMVVVIGPGPIGLLCMEMARLRGASQIIAIGTSGDDERLVLAREFGATLAINSSREDAVSKVMSLADQYGADLVIDTAGPAETLRLSMDLVRPNGQITKIGWGPKPVNLSLDPLIAKSVTLKGHFSHTWDVWEKCLVLMDRGQVDLDRLITHELPLDRWQEAFELVETKKAMKVVLTPIE
ncbi:MAG: zinc-binding dehydrogenase [Sedimentisphaerales bacterium]|jgi:alcohol dehydrogenase/L-iditol 2-dehydrogenase|nr:zinc-binding dehydrogenase [Sedimentisphaerales bacterium]